MGKLILALALASVLFVGGSALAGYNTLVGTAEAASEQWGNVQAQYQRRSDLIPNLVEVVRAAAGHEQSTHLAVTEARARAAELRGAAASGRLQEYEAAEAALSNAITQLVISVEAYPELRANQAFLDLMTQLEGTENRIATERRRYNETVNAHNTFAAQLPGRLWAALFGFGKLPYFQADPGAKVAPVVDFNRSSDR